MSTVLICERHETIRELITRSYPGPVRKRRVQALVQLLTARGWVGPYQVDHALRYAVQLGAVAVCPYEAGDKGAAALELFAELGCWLVDTWDPPMGAHIAPHRLLAGLYAGQTRRLAGWSTPQPAEHGAALFLQVRYWLGADGGHDERA